MAERMRTAVFRNLRSSERDTEGALERTFINMMSIDFSGARILRSF